jgi:hypothetical protein
MMKWRQGRVAHARLRYVGGCLRVAGVGRNRCRAAALSSSCHGRSVAIILLTKERSTMKPDRTMATRRQTPALAVMKSAPEVQEQIRRRAYELYEERGRYDGHDVEDWLQAESEMTKQEAKTAAAS